MTARIEAAARTVAGLSDKELGLSLKNQPEDVRPFLFPSERAVGASKGGCGTRSCARSVRPATYWRDTCPSYAMNRVNEQAT